MHADRRPTGAALGASLLAVVIVAAASSCSSSRPSASASGKAPLAAPGTVGVGVQATPTAPTDPVQQLAYTCDISVRVPRVDKAAGDALKLTQTVGGYVFAQSASYGDIPEASLSLRVPPGQFRSVLGQLASLGVLLDQTLRADDVTQQVTDLAGRLKTATASAERLRALLARAAASTDIVTIESELGKREQDIELIQGQMNALATRINFATINLKLVVRGTPKVSQNIPGFRRGLHSGWVAFVNVGKVLLTAFGTSLPFLPFAVIVLFLGIRYRRRRRAHPRERPKRTSPGPGATAYGPPFYPAAPPGTSPPAEAHGLTEESPPSDYVAPSPFAPTAVATQGESHPSD